MTLKNGREVDFLNGFRDIIRLAILGISGWVAIQFVEIRDNSKLQQERYNNIKLQQDQFNLKLNEVQYNNQILSERMEDMTEMINMIATEFNINIGRRKKYREKK